MLFNVALLRLYENFQLVRSHAHTVYIYLIHRFSFQAGVKMKTLIEQLFVLQANFRYKLLIERS